VSSRPATASVRTNSRAGASSRAIAACTAPRRPTDRHRLTCSEGTRRFDSEQRIAVSGRDHLGGRGVGRCARLTGERRDRAGVERGECDVRAGDAGLSRSEFQGRQVITHRPLPAGGNQQHSTVWDATRDVAEQGEAGVVRGMQILHDDEDRVAASNRVDQRDHRLGQPRPGSGGRCRVATGHLESGREHRRERCYPRCVRQFTESLYQLAAHLDPWREQGTSQVRSRTGSHGCSVTGGEVRELGDEPGLADTGIAVHDAQSAVPGLGQRPRRVQLAQLTITADERQQAGTGPYRRCRRCSGANLFGKPPRRFGRRDAQLATQPIGELLVDRKCRRPVIGIGERSHQHPRRLLGQRIVSHRPTCPADGSPGIVGLLGQVHEGRTEPGPVLVACHDRPLVVDTGE
jgi:hypothetical protein